MAQIVRARWLIEKAPMNASPSSVAAFPATLARLARPLPPALIEAMANRLLKRLVTTHPGLFERLDDYRNRRFAFLPSDLPFGFVVDPVKPSLRVFSKSTPFAADAAVEGPLFLLLALLEGRLDADAFFFSRELTVTGDMEAMLALRNALDDTGIDLTRDLAVFAGPFSGAATRAMVEIRKRVLKEKPPLWN